MDQFEAISKKNKRITAVVLGIPLLVAIILVAGILLLFVVGMGISENESFQKEIFQAEDMTPEEADSYLVRLTGDDDMDSSTVGYNVALAKIHMEKGDYDKAIEVCSSAIAAEASPFYNYYLGMAYLQKGLFDDAKSELVKVTVAEAESFYDSALYDSYDESQADAMLLKEEVQSRIKLIDAVSFLEEVQADDDITKEQVVSYVGRVKANKEFMEPMLVNMDSILLYLHFCKYAEEYEEIIQITSRAIEIKDDPAYHYYLAFAHMQTDAPFDQVAQELDSIFAQDALMDKKESVSNKIWIYDDFQNVYARKNNYEALNKIMEKSIDNQISFLPGDWLEVTKEFKSIVIERKPYDSAVLVDTDQDGSGDMLEKALGTAPDKKDTDGDGYEDEKELLFGHNPLKESPDDGLSSEDYSILYEKMMSYEPNEEDYRAVKKNLPDAEEYSRLKMEFLHLKINNQF